MVKYLQSLKEILFPGMNGHREKMCMGMVVADCDMPSTSGFIPSHTWRNCDGDSSDGGISDTDTHKIDTCGH